jgi:beta-glucosidase
MSGSPVVTRVDHQVNFDWGQGSPDAKLPRDSFSIRWTGKLVPPLSGDYDLGAKCDDGVRIYLDGNLVLDDWGEHAARIASKHVKLEAGREYDIRVEYFEKAGFASSQLVWSVPGWKPFEDAVRAAKDADAVILVLGISPDLEGEEMGVNVEGFFGGDRTNIDLPRVQEDLLRAVTAVGKPTVVVLESGSALAVNWAAAHVPAIVQAWYPGEEGGTALADVLFGDANPAGRLPVTFYKSAEDLPPFEDYNMEGRTYRYFRGEPLFPFGHGLSYTKFSYANLTIGPKSPKQGQDIKVSVDVTNSGGREGDEVVQLYVTDVSASDRVSIRSLMGFRRVSLKAGETKKVSFAVTPWQLSLVDKDGRRWVEPGEFAVSVGGKQPGFRGVADASTTEVISGSFTVSGDILELHESPSHRGS